VSEQHLKDAHRPGNGVYTVGTVAARLGVAPETVRSWGIRYGLVASARTAGGHRRFSDHDLQTMLRMQALVTAGHTPAEAARHAREAAGLYSVRAAPIAAASAPETRRQSGSRPEPPRRVGGPGGRVLAVPRASAQARGLARAAGRLDARTCTGLIREALIHSNAEQTWENLCRPVLQAAGLRWMRTGEGVDVEHVLSEALIAAVRSYIAFLPNPVNGRPVLLGCAPNELHSVPLHILAAALTEQRVPTLMLGAQVPPSAFATAARRTGASAMFVWQQAPVTGDPDAAVLAHPAPGLRLQLVLGGPGWVGVSPADGVAHVNSLAEAVALLRGTAR
jgi:hypothetical protein